MNQLGPDHLLIIDPLFHLAAESADPHDFWVTTYDTHKHAWANRILSRQVAEEILARAKRQSCGSQNQAP